MKASDNPYPSVHLDEQASDPSTPAADRWRLYAKSGGIYAINPAAAVVGPFGATGVGALLGYVAHTAGDETIASATMTDLDATNAAVTFTAPASGNVLVRLSATVAPAQTTGAYVTWGLRESTSNIAGADGESMAVRAGTNAAVEYQGATKVFVLTGISAGSHTYKWSWNSSTGTANLKANSNSPAVMEVWALP